MTKQEAVEKLKIHKEWNLNQSTSEAVEMAIKALEQQIPRSVYFDDTTYMCSSCNTQPYEDYAINKKPMYCCVCGQKLDWKNIRVLADEEE